MHVTILENKNYHRQVPLASIIIEIGVTVIIGLITILAINLFLDFV